MSWPTFSRDFFPSHFLSSPESSLSFPFPFRFQQHLSVGERELLPPLLPISNHFRSTCIERDMGLISNRVQRDELKAGDHIYSWRTAYFYAHHGIYMGDNKVIHFTSQKVVTGTVFHKFLTSSMPKRSEVPCPLCTQQEEGDGVVSSCLDCFIAGGSLYRFEYAVNDALFLAARGGTCTRAPSDPVEVVVHRAKYLLNNGFGSYNVSNNNCEDFAIYCKTGLRSAGQKVISGQAASVKAMLSAAFSLSRCLVTTTNVFEIAATAIEAYCSSRIAADIDKRSDLIKEDVEDLTARLGKGTTGHGGKRKGKIPKKGTKNFKTHIEGATSETNGYAIRCFFCKKKGHMKKDCAKHKKWCEERGIDLHDKTKPK